MSSTHSIEYYESLHNSKYPNSLIKVLYLEGNNVYFETEFGECRRNIYNLGKTNYNIHSAINKTDFTLKKLYSIYGDKYDFSKITYKNVKEKVIVICKIHGEISSELRTLLKGNLVCWECNKEYFRKTHSGNISKFINKANKIHNFKYDYSKTIYIHSHKKINIVCPIHGEFTQTVLNHLNGSGCQKCGKIKLKNTHSINPTGWTLDNWVKKAEVSKHFDSFKIYILKCWNEKEEFYKIGRTFNSINQRFRCKSNMPYNFKILKFYEDDAKTIYKKELDLKKLNKNNKYIPLLKFNGMHECFSQIK